MSDAISDSPQAIHVLLIEDSETQAVRLTLELEDEGFKVSRVSSAEQGREFLQQELPDLLIVDYFLPGIHGDAFCRQVRLRPETRHLPLLILTSETSNLTQVHLLDSGADDYVPKSADFDVLLARIQAQLRKRATKSHAPVNHVGFEWPRLLAIDDSLTYLEYLAAELEQEGYLVETASHGLEGLAKLEQQRFDCILIDLVMPELDGIEVCHRISQRSQQAQQPIALLMLTSQDNPEALSRALEAGADDFVGKQNDVVILKGRIRALLRRKFSQDENRRLMQEIIQTKELEAKHALEAKAEAEGRAALASQLELALGQLQKSSQELEQLAYVSAHDLQEPLRQLINYSQLLGQRYAEVLDQRGLRYLDFIGRNTDRMRHQISALLSYLSVSTEPPVFQELDCRILLSSVQERLMPLLQETQAEIYWSHVLPLLRACPRQIELLLWHLIHNALTFSSPERPPRVSISLEDLGSEWRLCVQDNGRGIESRFYEQIFALFRHLEQRGASSSISPTQTGQSSSGMGLAICRKITERHGGRLWVESEAGIGSRFFATFSKHPEQVMLQTSVLL